MQVVRKIKMSKVLILLIFTCLLFLDACMMTPTKSAQGNDTSASKSDISKGFEEDVRNFRHSNKMPIDAPPLEAYLNGVLNKITANISNPTPSIVKVYPSREFSAYTLNNGVIFISVGALFRLKSEDEVAALLSHEYSHLLRKHHKKDSFEHSVNTLLGTVKMYLLYRGEGEISDGKRSFAVSEWVFENAFFPSWNRTQENDADLTGMSLLIKAGYNPEAFVLMLKNLSGSIEEKRDEIDAAALILAAKKKDKSLLIKQSLSPLRNSLSREYDSVEIRLISVREEAGRYPDSVLQPYQKSQYYLAMRDPQVMSLMKSFSFSFDVIRKGASNSYLAYRDWIKVYPNNLPDLPYFHMVGFHIYNSVGRKADVKLSLERAIATNAAPLTAYLTLSDIYEHEHKYESSFSLLEEINTRFNSPDEILPDLLRLGNKLELVTAKYELKCYATMNLKLIKRCKEEM